MGELRPQRPVDTRHAAGQRQGPDVFRRPEAEPDDPPRSQPGGAVPEELPGVETVGLPGGGVRHGHQDQVIGVAGAEVAAGVGKDEAHRRGRQGLSALRGEMGQHHFDHPFVQFHYVDLLRVMAAEGRHNPLRSSAQKEDPSGPGVLEGDEMGKGLPLDPLGFQGEDVIFEDRRLSGTPGYGDPPVGGIPGRQQVGMVPGAGHGVDPGRSRKGNEGGGGQRPGRP